MRSPHFRRSKGRPSLVSTFIVFAFLIWCVGIIYLMYPSVFSEVETTDGHDFATINNVDGSSQESDTRILNECPSMKYWNPSKFDKLFSVPYAKYGDSHITKYVSFEPDYGGFNNIRMTLESLVVFARATNRTIVLPPKSPIYLLKNDNHTSSIYSASSSSTQQQQQQKPKLRSITDFFSEGIAALKQSGIVKIISFEEFILKESHGLVASAASRQLSEENSFIDTSMIRDTLLSWNRNAEKGEETARKKIRQWIRSAVCNDRIGDATEQQIAYLSSIQNGDGETDSGSGVKDKGGDGNGGAPFSHVVKFPPTHSNSLQDHSVVGLSQARCPKFEPLKEALLFGPWFEKTQQSQSESNQLSNHEKDKGDGSVWSTSRDNPFIPPSHQYSVDEFVTGKRRKHFVDRHQAAEPWIHFQTDIKTGYRSLFTHWYTFFMFEDYATDLHMKRIVRDYIHYDSEVFCVANKIITKLNQEALDLTNKKSDSLSSSKGNSGNSLSSKNSGNDVLWSSIHIRHGELQYTNVQISPEELLEETKGWLDRKGELLYIGTDEKDLRWFKPLEQRHELRFLSDYMNEIGDLDKALYGMVEQVVMSRGRTFTGTWFSTFSAYVCRLRGYATDIKFEESSCYVYAPQNKKLDFQSWKMPSHAFYPREWSLAWEGIDYFQHDYDKEQYKLSEDRLLYNHFKTGKMIYPDEAVKKKKQEQAKVVNGAS